MELGNEHNAFASNLNQHPSALCGICQTSGSNAQQVNNAIAQLLEDEKKNMPEGMEIEVLMSTNDFLDASMHEVIKTLLEALVLVVLIVLLFLHDWQSTLIPFVGIFVSLIGTFAFMQAVGFTINLITLFALVLVIGTVVDDSIVVVEAVHEKLDAGYKSGMKAAIHYFFVGLYGCVYPCKYDVRYQRCVLPSVWTDNGCGSRYICPQCFDPLACAVCAADTAEEGSGSR